MIIDHCYWECNCEYHCARQVEKKALESHFWKQEKASTTSNIMASQNKANTSLAASSTKLSFSKPSPSPAPKKQPNSPQVDLFSKLASNGKLTSNECKKQLKNNLCLYYSIGDYKLDFYLKKQTTVNPKGYSASATADSPVNASEKLLEK